MNNNFENNFLVFHSFFLEVLLRISKMNNLKITKFINSLWNGTEKSESMVITLNKLKDQIVLDLKSLFEEIHLFIDHYHEFNIQETYIIGTVLSIITIILWCMLRRDARNNSKELIILKKKRSQSEMTRRRASTSSDPVDTNKEKLNQNEETNNNYQSNLEKFNNEDTPTNDDGYLSDSALQKFGSYGERLRFRKRDKLLFFGKKMLRTVNTVKDRTVETISAQSAEKSKNLYKILSKRLLSRNDMNDLPSLSTYKRNQLPEFLLDTESGIKYDPNSTDLPIGLINLIRSVKVFGYFDNKIIMEMCKYIELKMIYANNYLFKIGDVDDSIYVVESGKIQVFITDEKRNRHKIKECTQGSHIFSLLSILDALTGNVKPYKTVSAKAVEDTSVLRLPGKAFHEVLRKYPEHLVRITQIIIVRLQRVTFTALHNYLGLTSEIMKSNIDMKQSKKQRRKEVAESINTNILELSKLTHQSSCHISNKCQMPEAFESKLIEKSLIIEPDKFLNSSKMPPPNKSQTREHLKASNSNKKLGHHHQYRHHLPSASFQSSVDETRAADSSENSDTNLKTPQHHPPPPHHKRTNLAQSSHSLNKTSSLSLNSPIEANSVNVESQETLKGDDLNTTTSKHKKNNSETSENEEQGEQTDDNNDDVDDDENETSSSENGSEFGECLNYNALNKKLPLVQSIIAEKLKLKNQKILDGKVRLVSIAEGTILNKEGDYNSSLIYLIQGLLISTQVELNSEEESTLFFTHPDQFCDNLSVLSGEPCLFSIKAKQDSEIAVIYKENFHRIIGEEPNVVLSVAHHIVKRMSPFVRQIDFALEWNLIESGARLFRFGHFFIFAFKFRNSKFEPFLDKTKRLIILTLF
jgi:CRP-like cAMP-binding protein